MERPVSKFRLSVVVFAGLAGGAAEIVWIALYAAFTQASGMEIARQVAASVVPGAAEAAYDPALGIATHLILSLIAATAFALAVWVPYARGTCSRSRTLRAGHSRRASRSHLTNGCVDAEPRPAPWGAGRVRSVGVACSPR